MIFPQVNIILSFHLFGVQANFSFPPLFCRVVSFLSGLIRYQLEVEDYEFNFLILMMVYLLTFLYFEL